MVTGVMPVRLIIRNDWEPGESASYLAPAAVVAGAEEEGLAGKQARRSERRGRLRPRQPGRVTELLM